MKIEEKKPSVLDELEDEYGDKQCTFADVEAIGKRMLSSLPKLDIDKFRDEMFDMHVDV